MLSRSLCLLSFLLLVSTTIPAQSDQKDGRYYESLARKAYQEKNYQSFLENMKLAAELRPNHPRLMYNLAIAYALNTKPDEAISLLRREAEMGLVLPAANDED